MLWLPTQVLLAQTERAKATIYIYRPKGQVLKPSIFINGVDVVRLPGGTYCVLTLDPGDISFAIDKPKYGLHMNVEGGETYFH